MTKKRVVPAVIVVLMVQSMALGQTHTAEVNGVSLPYEVEGVGLPLVLIHGWGVNRGFWDDDVPAFAERYRVIRYDRRGFGAATGKPDVTADPADLNVLLNQLGVSRTHIVGHSQGANVALSFAREFPDMVEGLVLFGPGPLPGQPRSDDLPDAADWVTIGQTEGLEALRAAIGQWAMENFGGPIEEDVRAKAQALLATYSGADLLDPAPPSNLVRQADVADLEAVTAPTLVVYGEHDMRSVRTSAGLLADGIPGARRNVLSGAGHTANWQQPERFAAAVLEFLRSVDQAPE
jgi:pimeloyl-ACP methyl ester carboxylesterase